MASTTGSHDGDEWGGGATVLLVEDDAVTRRTLRRVLEALETVHEVATARDGVEALQALDDGGRRHADPDVVLLDLDMPRLDGHGALRGIREGLALQDLPVVVASTSDRPEDVRRARERGADAFVRKPEGPEETEVLSDWLRRCWLPGGSGAEAGSRRDPSAADSGQ